MEIMTVRNENNNYSISELEYIRQYIESMDKHNQTEILKIIHGDTPNCINENKNGIYINMTELSDETIEKIENLIKYVNIQENEINIVEKTKEDYRNDFFNKENKEGQ